MLTQNNLLNMSLKKREYLHNLKQLARFYYMDRSRGGGGAGGPDPPEKLQKYRVYKQYTSGSPEK